MKLKMTKSASITFGAVVYLMSTGYSLASAVEDKIYTGAGCHAFLGAQGGDFNHYSRSLRNVAKSSRWTLCPIAREKVTSSSKGVVAFVRVKRSAAASASFQCYLLNYTVTGALTSWGASPAYSGSGAVPLSMNMSSTNAYGHYAIQCRVPSGSDLFSYRVVEF